MSIRYSLLKLFLILICAFLYASLLVGCGGSDDSEDSPTELTKEDVADMALDEWNKIPSIKCITDTDVETNKECVK